MQVDCRIPKACDRIGCPDCRRFASAPTDRVIRACWGNDRTSGRQAAMTNVDSHERGEYLIDGFRVTYLHQAEWRCACREFVATGSCRHAREAGGMREAQVLIRRRLVARVSDFLPYVRGLSVTRSGTQPNRRVFGRGKESAAWQLPRVPSGRSDRRVGGWQEPVAKDEFDSVMHGADAAPDEEPSAPGGAGFPGDQSCSTLHSTEPRQKSPAASG